MQNEVGFPGKIIVSDNKQFDGTFQVNSVNHAASAVMVVKHLADVLITSRKIFFVESSKTLRLDPAKLHAKNKNKNVHRELLFLFIASSNYR